MINFPEKIFVTLNESIAQFEMQETLQGFSLNLITLPFDFKVHVLPKLITDFGRFTHDQRVDAFNYFNYWKNELKKRNLSETLDSVIYDTRITGRRISHD